MANKFHEFKHKLDASLRDSSKPWTSILDKAEKKSGVDRLYIFLASAVIVGLWLVFGYCAQLLCNTVGFIYPAYVSIRAIESRAKDDDTKWLTYWVVYAIFSILEYFANAIVNWFPLYWLTKCIFLIWLMIPTEFNGSLLLYHKVIKPYFLKHHKTIDDTVGKVKDTEYPAPAERNSGPNIRSCSDNLAGSGYGHWIPRWNEKYAALRGKNATVPCGGAHPNRQNASSLGPFA